VSRFTRRIWDNFEASFGPEIRNFAPRGPQVNANHDWKRHEQQSNGQMAVLGIEDRFGPEEMLMMSEKLYEF
jgi:hypothetical protein